MRVGATTAERVALVQVGEVGRAAEACVRIRGEGVSSAFSSAGPAAGGQRGEGHDDAPGVASASEPGKLDLAGWGWILNSWSCCSCLLSDMVVEGGVYWDVRGS